MPRGWGAVALAVLVLAAGCSGFGADDGSTPGSDRTTYGVPERTTTLESTDVPAGTPTGGTAGETSGDREGIAVGDAPPAEGEVQLDVEEMAPGLTEQVIAAPSRLARAHREVLANRSYRVHLNRTVHYPNGTTRTERVDARVGTGERHVVERTVTSPAGDRTRGVVVADGREQRRVAGSLPASRVVPSALDYRGLVERAFRASTMTSARAIPGHVTLAVYRIRAVGTDPRGFVVPPATVSELDLEAVVDARGLVRNLSVSYVVVDDDRRVRVRTRLWFAGEGIPTVDPLANGSATTPGGQSVGGRAREQGDVRDTPVRRVPGG